MPEKEEPMTVAAAEIPVTTLADLVELSERMDVPDGYRVEIIDGSLSVSPTPLGRHTKIVRLLEDMLRPSLPEGALDVQPVTIEIARTGERYIPDLVVLPESAIHDDQWLFAAEACLLTVEVTSPSNAGIDRVQKLHGYAQAGVPLYLLVDAVERTVSLFGDPVKGVYSAHATVPYGGKIHIPEPFDVIIDTAEFS